MISDRIIGLHSVLLPLFKRLLSNKPPCLGFHSIKHTPRASQIIRHTFWVQVYFSWVNQSLTHKNPQKVKIFPGGVLLGIIGGVCDPVLQILTLFWTKKCIFSYPSSDLASEIHTRFQTWRLRNYFIITLIGTRTKKISRSHVSLSFYLIWNWNHEYVRTLLRVSSRTIPDYRPKWAKPLPVFRPKRRRNPTLWGGTYIYGLYMGVPSYPPGFSLFPKKIKAWGLYLQASSLSILAWYREKVGMWPLQMYAAKIKILTFNSCTIRWKFYS